MEKPPVEPSPNGRPRYKFLNGKPPNVPKYRRTFDAIFDPVGEATAVPRLSAEATRVLNRKLPALKTSFELLRTVAAEEPTIADKFATNLAESTFDSDPSRSLLRETASAVVTGVSGKLSSITQLRLEAMEERSAIDQFRYVPPESPSTIFSIGKMPSLVTLLFWIMVFVIAIYAEINNAVFLVMTSGLEFQDDPMGATCFSIVYVLAPLSIFKFVDSKLRSLARKRFDTATIMVGIPAAIFGIILFSWKVGEMQEEIDLFNAEHAGFDPPFWMVMATAMVLLAFCVMIIPLFIRSALHQLLSYRAIENDAYVDASTRIAAFDNVVIELEALQVRAKGIVNCLDAEKKRHVSECLAALHRCRQQFMARKSSLFAE